MFWFRLMALAVAGSLVGCGSNVDVPGDSADDGADGTSAADSTSSADGADGADSVGEVTSTSSSPPNPVTTLMPTTASASATVGPGQMLNDGTYLLVFSSPLAPELPLQYIASVRTFDGEFSMSLTPLSLDLNSTTTPREPLGDFRFDLIEIPLQPDGTFTFTLPEYFVPGLANPITGSDIIFHADFEAFVPDSEFFCGTASGEVLSPLTASLDGSTFAGIFLATDGPLPVDFPLGC